MACSAVQERMEKASGGFFLIGLGVLWLAGLSFWPWILAVFAADAAFKALIKEGMRGVITSTFWLVGFLVLFLTGSLWPGILILIGLSIVLKAMLAEDKDGFTQEKRKRKPKRLSDKPKGIPVKSAARRGPVVIYDDEEEDEWEELDYIMAVDMLDDDSDPDGDSDGDGW